jgi:hypothetical protein
VIFRQVVCAINGDIFLFVLRRIMNGFKFDVLCFLEVGIKLLHINCLMLKMKYFLIKITRLIGVLFVSIVAVYQRIFIIFQ